MNKRYLPLPSRLNPWSRIRTLERELERRDAAIDALSNVAVEALIEDRRMASDPNAHGRPSRVSEAIALLPAEIKHRVVTLATAQDTLGVSMRGASMWQDEGS